MKKHLLLRLCFGIFLFTSFVGAVSHQSSNNNVFDLEVVFYNVTTCYVADYCLEGDSCDIIKNYKPPYNELFKFKDGTLQTVKKSESGDYNLSYCIQSTFNEEEIKLMQKHVKKVIEYLHKWTKGDFKIKAHFRYIDADMGSGYLNKEFNADGTRKESGYERGKNPSIEQYEHYFNQSVSEIDRERMDLFVSFVDPFPDATGNEIGDGLLVQQYIGAVTGEINGVPPVMIASFPKDKPLMIPIMIHELNHVVNWGHYFYSNLTDVYGVENREMGEGFNETDNPRPHCNSTKHYSEFTGMPNQHSYFPDSYNWLDPMWKTNPLNIYQESDVSYCLNEAPYPTTNPLNSNDNYQDIRGLGENMKYYKFIYEAHWWRGLGNKLVTDKDNVR